MFASNYILEIIYQLTAIPKFGASTLFELSLIYQSNHEKNEKIISKLKDGIELQIYNWQQLETVRF